MEDKTFVRFTAIAAVVAVFTTVLNTQLPHFYTSPSSFEEGAALVNNDFYMARQWILLIHPLPTLLLSIGLFLAMRKQQPGLALAGLLFTFLEKSVEFIGQTIQLFTVNLHWRQAYLVSTDTAEKEQLTSFIKNFAAIWNDCFFVLWVSYFLAAICFGVGLWKMQHARATSVFLLASALLTLIMILSDYGKQYWLQSVLPVFYPLALLVSRTLIAVYLWKSANEKASSALST
jgi:hypothetical protein